MIHALQASMPWNEPIRSSQALWLDRADAHLQRFRPHHLLGCLKVWHRATRTAHSFLPLAAKRAQFRRLRHGQIAKAETWVWLEAAEVLAFMSLPAPGVIGGLFVHPKAQRCGIGRLLIEHARQRHGALRVDVYQANTPARAFYGALGFTTASLSRLDADGEPYAIETLRAPSA